MWQADKAQLSRIAQTRAQWPLRVRDVRCSSMKSILLGLALMFSFAAPIALPAQVVVVVRHHHHHHHHHHHRPYRQQ